MVHISLGLAAFLGCIYQDYNMYLRPIFNNRMFEQEFRITCGHVARLLQCSGMVLGVH
jgi:hypothetical protein